MQEQELVKKLQADKEKAFKYLYDSYVDRVYNLCFRFFGSQAEAEDAVQEIFCKIYFSIANFRAEARLASWIYRITMNHCLNVLRQAKRAKIFSLEKLLDGEWQTISPSSDDPHEKVEQMERQDLIQKAINGLSGKQRIAFILYRYEGLAYQEIAEILGCSVAAVESRLHQAKQNLAKKLLPLLKE